MLEGPAAEDLMSTARLDPSFLLHPEHSIDLSKEILATDVDPFSSLFSLDQWEWTGQEEYTGTPQFSQSQNTALSPEEGHTHPQVPTPCPSANNEIISQDVAPTRKGVPAPDGTLGDKIVQLPAHKQVLELFNIFFDRFHPLLPCLHERRFMDNLNHMDSSQQPSALVWAILATAAKSHTDTSIQGYYKAYLTQARIVFDEGVRSLKAPTENLQAAVWIIYQTFGTAEIPEMWVFLGKACRFASLLGFDRHDSTRAPSPYSTPPRDLIEVEERRKTMWALFYLDKALSCLCGWALALNDSQFMVHFPIDDEIFQRSTSEVRPRKIFSYS